MTDVLEKYTDDYGQELNSAWTTVKDALDNMRERYSDAMHHPDAMEKEDFDEITENGNALLGMAKSMGKELNAFVNNLSNTVEEMNESIAQAMTRPLRLRGHPKSGPFYLCHDGGHEDYTSYASDSPGPSEPVANKKRGRVRQVSSSSSEASSSSDEKPVKKQLRVNGGSNDDEPVTLSAKKTRTFLWLRRDEWYNELVGAANKTKDSNKAGKVFRYLSKINKNKWSGDDRVTAGTIKTLIEKPNGKKTKNTESKRMTLALLEGIKKDADVWARYGQRKPESL